MNIHPIRTSAPYAAAAPDTGSGEDRPPQNPATRSQGGSIGPDCLPNAKNIGRNAFSRLINPHFHDESLHCQGALDTTGRSAAAYGDGAALARSSSGGSGRARLTREQYEAKINSGLAGRNGWAATVTTEDGRRAAYLGAAPVGSGETRGHSRASATPRLTREQYEARINAGLAEHSALAATNLTATGPRTSGVEQTASNYAGNTGWHDTADHASMARDTATRPTRDEYERKINAGLRAGSAPAAGRQPDPRGRLPFMQDPTGSLGGSEAAAAAPLSSPDDAVVQARRRELAGLRTSQAIADDLAAAQFMYGGTGPGRR